MALPVCKEETYTYYDYLQWPDDERWELIDGVPYSLSESPLNMAAAPFRQHQQVVVELCRQLANFLRDKPCEVYVAPFDVRFPKVKKAPQKVRDSDIFTVVQPDLVVICDQEKLDERGCLGAPDFIIEIVSPSTAAKDQVKKVALYEKQSVKEYWIVHPTDQLVTVRVLDEQDKYGIPAIYEGKGKLKVNTLPGLEIDLDAVFKE